ncbi:MAG TPA: cell division protein FtsQ/DivIB [Candidatus Saccharimonadia bacterium]|nr:cell division protein FtsQ/DivIB [Candidatus Saccharimonadia bacterium]
MSSFAFRLAAWIVALALVALPIVGLVNGWFASDRWPFRQLEVEAEFSRVSAEQLRAAVTPQLERGFFAVELDRVRQSVEALPWVESARVRKRWPDRLEMRVVERKAAAVWGDARLVSTAGELFAVPGDVAPDGLPRLAGPEDRAREVLEFYGDAHESMAGSGHAVAGAALSSRGSWSLALGNGARIVIGREAPQARLERFVDTLPRIAASPGAVWVRADLRYANGYALEWRLPEPAAPVPSDIPPLPGPTT